MNGLCGLIVSTIIHISGDLYCPQGVIVNGGSLYLHGFTLSGGGKGDVGVILRGRNSKIEGGRIADYYVGIHKQFCESCQIQEIIVKAHYPFLEDKSNFE